jgi:hypothetical protein
MTSGGKDEPVIERILDLAVYGPVGLALSVVEAVPGLVRKGRDRLVPQVGVARTVGEFAVRQGYRQFVGFATSRGAFPFRTAEPGKTYTAYTARADGPGEPDGHEGPSERSWPAQGGPGHPGTVQTRAGPVEADGGWPAEAGGRQEERPKEPRVGDLAIPSYDSLSASQVVQRLAGLSREEVAAVAAYEAATRRRKTVLDRAEQLLKTSR